MQDPEEFCRNIDSKLRRSIIFTLAAVFAAACGASLLMYIFAPTEDFMADSFSGENIRSGNSDSFFMTTAQSDGTAGFSVISSELTDGVFTAVILGTNSGDGDIILQPHDFSVYTTDVRNGGKPELCRVNMTEDIILSSGCETEFSVSVNVPQDFSYDGCKASAVISAGGRGKCIGIMLN